MFDCGVFLCMFTKAIASNISLFSVDQKDMDFHRKRMVLCLVENYSILADVEKVAFYF